MVKVKFQLPERYVYKTNLSVLIADIGSGGHLTHEAMLRLSWEARLRFFQALNYNKGQVEGLDLILGDVEIRYLSPAFHGENLIFTLYIDEASFTPSGFTLINRIQHQNERDVAIIVSHLIFFDTLSQKVGRIPARFRRKIENKNP